MKKLFHVIKLVIFAVTFFSCESSEILSGKVHSENESNSAEIRDTERVLGAARVSAANTYDGYPYLLNGSNAAWFSYNSGADTRAVILTRATPENMGSYFPSIFEPGTPMLYAYIGFNHHGRDYQIRCYPLLITPGSLQVWGFFSDKKVQYSDFAHVSFGQAEFSYTEPYFNSKGEVILGGWRCTKNCFSGEDNGSNRWKTGRLEIESVGLSFNPERFNIKGALIKDDGVRVNFNLSQPRWF